MLDASVPVVVRNADAVTARSIGVLDGGALLVRPDGVPAALWRTDHNAAAQLGAAVRSLVGEQITEGDRVRNVA